VLIMSITGPVAAKLLEVPKLADLPMRLGRGGNAARRAVRVARVGGAVQDAHAVCREG
jgi:hypothetical protein